MRFISIEYIYLQDCIKFKLPNISGRIVVWKLSHIFVVIDWSLSFTRLTRVTLVSFRHGSICTLHIPIASRAGFGVDWQKEKFTSEIETWSYFAASRQHGRRYRSARELSLHHNATTTGQRNSFQSTNQRSSHFIMHIISLGSTWILPEWWKWRRRRRRDHMGRTDERTNERKVHDRVSKIITRSFT